MISIPFELLSNDLGSKSGIDFKAHQNFHRNLLKESNRFENCPPKNKAKEYFEIFLAEEHKKEEIIQEKVLNWFSKLGIDERKIICSIKSKWLTTLFPQLYSIYKDNNTIVFQPTEETEMLFQNFEDNNNIKREDYNIFSSNEKCDKNGNNETILNEYIKDPNDLFYYKKYFIYYNKIESKKDKEKDINALEIEFLNSIKIISSDQYTITLSEELLSDFDKFKKIFKYITNNSCFKDWLLPKQYYRCYNFKLPLWISKIKSNLTLFQIIICFFEQQILLYYEYFFYTNRIYQSPNQNNIIEIYKEINNIIGQLNKESSYLNNILTENIIKETINKISNNNNVFNLNIYKELKNYIDNYNNEKQKIKKLLDKLTFLDFNDVINGKIIIYDSYKKFILNYFIDNISNELIKEDKTKKKGKKHNKKNKNKNNKNEVKENENIKKENENEKENEIIKDKEKENEHIINEDIKKENEIKENKIEEEKKNKKHKECFLFTNNTKKDKKNKSNKLNKTNLNKNEENKNESNTKLIRIISKESISTLKSSNYQDDVFSNSEEDCISISNDLNDYNHNIIENNIQKSNIQNNKLNDIENNNPNKNKNYIEFNAQKKHQNNIKKNFTNNSYHNNNINKIYNKNQNNNFNKIHNNISNNNNNKIYNYIPNNINNKIHNYNCNNIPQNNFSSKHYSQNLNYNNNIYNNNTFYNVFNYNYYDQEIANYCSITDNNIAILNKIKDSFLNILENKIKKYFINKYNLTFGHYGSYYTGLSIEGSDIDICIIFKKLKNDNLLFYQELFDYLEENKPNLIKYSYEIEQYFNAKIPRITMKIDISEEIKKTGLTNYGYLDYDDMNILKIDFTFNENEQYLINNTKNVDYVKSQIKIYPQIRPVILVLKRYLKKMKMNEVYFGGISSYSLFLLVLNSIKSYPKEISNMQISNSQLLIKTLYKFSFFNFSEYGIGKDNYEYILEIINYADIPHILDPLTGNNVAKVGRCKGEDIKETFNKGYNLLYLGNYQNFCNYGLFCYNQTPNISIKDLFKLGDQIR